MQKIQQIIAYQLDKKAENINESDKIIDDLGGDSIDQIEIIMDIEEVFDIQIPDEDVEKLITVGDIIQYVKTKEDIIEKENQRIKQLNS